MDKLISALREAHEYAMEWGENPFRYAALYKKAADAIEELAAFKAQITDGHFYLMRDGVLYEAKIEMPKGKIVNLPPIEFAEPPKEKT